MTPEGKVKAAVKAVLARYPESYVYMSVPFGYGGSTLDFIVCHYGQFVSIETKKVGGKPTPRQSLIIGQIERAGGKHFTIAGADQCGPLEEYLEQVKHAASSSQSQAPYGWSAARPQYRQSIPRSEIVFIWGRQAFAPASPSDGDFSSEEDGLRRAEPDPDAL